MVVLYLENHNEMYLRKDAKGWNNIQTDQDPAIDDYAEDNASGVVRPCIVFNLDL